MNLKLTHVNKKMYEMVYNVINNTMLEPNIYDESTRKIWNKTKKKIRKNQQINFKDIFGNEEYSTPEYYKDYLESLKSGETLNVAADEQIKLLNFVEKDYWPNQETFSKNINDLIKAIPWASESLLDFAETFSLFKNHIEFHTFGINSTVVLKTKMIFKEMYSLIDRLRTEASVEISSHSMGIDRDFFSYEENEEFISKWRKYMPQDIILNGDPNKISNGVAFITKFNMDDDGWLEIEYDDMDTIISPRDNGLFKSLRDTRNFHEHSANNRLNQNFIEGGIINVNDSESIKNIKLHNQWQAQTYLTIIVYLYHLFRISEVHYDALFSKTIDKNKNE